jgi:hypothetical protein
MKCVWYRDQGTLNFDGHTIEVTSKVRNELNGKRALGEKPVYTEPPDDGTPVPYMPRPFPIGTWKIVAIIPKVDPYMAPVFISTDAWQMVEQWTEVDGRYGHNTHTPVKDAGYGFHNSVSPTTLGCGKIARIEDREAFVAWIRAAWDNHDDVYVEVV